MTVNNSNSVQRGAAEAWYVWDPSVKPPINCTITNKNYIAATNVYNSSIVFGQMTSLHEHLLKYSRCVLM